MDTRASDELAEDPPAGVPVVPSPVASGDLGSASRSCLAILLLGAAIVVLVCVSLTIRLLF